MATKVVNKKNNEPYDVYIGRPSPFGNPFIIGRDGNRMKVIERYISYFHTRIATDEGFREKVVALKDKTLGCYCSPLPCHGHVIAEWVDKGDYEPKL